MNRTQKIKGCLVYLFKGLEKRLFKSRFSLFYFAVLIICFIENGIWHFPVAGSMLEVSQDININPLLAQPNKHYLLYSFLGPALANSLNMNKSLFLYSLMNLMLFAYFFTSLIYWVREKHGDFPARSLLILFFLSPVPNVVLTWLGSPDSLTIGLAVAMIILRHKLFLLSICSFLLGINHFEQGVIIILLISIFLLLSDSKKAAIQFGVISLASITIGRLLLDWHFSQNNFDIAMTRVGYFLQIGELRRVRAIFGNPFALLFSLFNSATIFIVFYIAYFWKTKTANAVVICIVIAFGVMLGTLDPTRVFSILTFPLLILMVISPLFSNLRYSGGRLFKEVLTVCFVIGLFIPRLNVWDGRIYSSAYFNLLGLILGNTGR